MLSPELTQSLASSWDFFIHLAIVLIPLFILGSFTVALFQEYLPPERVQRVLERYDGGTGNVVAASIGSVTTFCSCSTVPILAGLLRAGSPLGLAFSFLLASPLVNELAILLLAGLFGVKIAGLYVLITFSSAIILGMIIGRFDLDSHLKDTDLFGSNSQVVAADGGQITPTATSDAACGCNTTCSTNIGPVSKTHKQRIRIATRDTGSFFIDLLPYLVLGMTAGAIVHGFVPTDLISQYLGPNNPLAVPTAAVAGAPIYVSMSSMLPIAAALAEQGIPIGTVLAFVVGSAGVSIPNLILLNKLFDRTLLALYALTVVSIGVLVGVLFNFILI